MYVLFIAGCVESILWLRSPRWLIHHVRNPPVIWLVNDPLRQRVDFSASVSMSTWPFTTSKRCGWNQVAAFMASEWTAARCGMGAGHPPVKFYRISMGFIWNFYWILWKLKHPKKDADRLEPGKHTGATNELPSWNHFAASFFGLLYMLKYHCICSSWM